MDLIFWPTLETECQGKKNNNNIIIINLLSVTLL